MIGNANEGNSHAVATDSDGDVRELSEQFRGTSPTPRSAAYHSDIELVGRSQAFVDMMKQIDVVAGIRLPVLLTGDSGVGKEFVAAALHHRSGVSDGPFVAINSATIPAELVEATVFGGDQERSGLLAKADGGTVFFDEITQTSPTFQTKLLGVLETGELIPIGTGETQIIDVRVIAASSCNFEQEVASGRFSRNLFEKLSAVSINLPPLADSYQEIMPENSSRAEPVNDDWVTLSEIEGRYVARVLEHTRGNKQAAARVLAVDRKTLDRMIKRHNIDCQRSRVVRTKASAHG